MAAYQILFEAYERHPEQLNTIMNDVMSGVRMGLDQIPQVNVSSLSDYDQVKDHLMMQVIPVEPNAEKLETGD